MKKICLFVCLFIFGVFIVGCGASVKSQILNSVSDIRYNFFLGQNEDVSISLMTGMRENPYNYDGISNKKCEFGIITLTIKNNVEYVPMEFTLKIDETEMSGVLEENPYDHTFMTDIKKIVDCESQVYITIKDITDKMVLTCESENWKIQYQDALEIGIKETAQDIELFVESKKLKAEVYLKIIYDEKNTENPYYWYFGILGENKNNISIIIHTETGEVLTKTNNFDN